MKRLFLSSGVLSLVLFVSAPAPAMPPGHGARPAGPHGGGAPGFAPLSILPLLLRSADLSDQQKTQVNEIVRQRGETFRSLFGDLNQANEELSDKVLLAGPVTRDDLAPLVSRVVELRSNLLKENMAVLLEIRNILSPEQIAKAAAARAQQKEHPAGALPPGHPPASQTPKAKD